MSTRRWLPAPLLGAGVLFSSVALVDPQRAAGGILGPLLALLGVVAAAGANRGRPRIVMPALLSLALSAASAVQPQFAADSRAYYAYLRSAYFDHDLDFSNEWQAWGSRPHQVTETGLGRNVQSVGPALVWAPFYVLADVYVRIDRALGCRHSRDGYSLPYLRATALGTIVVALLGTWALVLALDARHARQVALLSALGSVAASPILYYVFVMPAMAHGLVYGISAALVWAWQRARREPSLAAWVLVGGCLGLLVLVRWQAAVLVLLVGPLAIQGLLQRSVRPLWLAAAAGVAVLGFLPQMLAWRLLFGTLLTLPQGGAFLDWSSPHLVDALFSADHGFFSWTPLMLAAFGALLVCLPRDPLLFGGSLAVLVGSAWVNGSVVTWSGGDAFGARRFDLCVPLAAFGIALLVDKAASVARRSPALVPAVALLAATVWNVSLIASFRHGRYRAGAPIDRVAGDQGNNLRLAAQRLLGLLAGERGRGLAYKYFSGEYFYSKYNRSGTLDLAHVPKQDLLGGWSRVYREPGEPAFRWALFPRACVRIPLEAPVELRVAVSARAPAGGQPQLMSVLWNEHVVGTATVGTHWGEHTVVLPVSAGVSGENALCLRFGRPAPRAEAAPQLATAAVSRIQLP